MTKQEFNDMKHTLYIILSACLLSLNACTSDDLINTEENHDSEVRLMANVNSGNTTRAENDDNKTLPEGIKEKFTSGDKIHFVNTYQFAPPVYKENTIFTCTGVSGEYGYKFINNNTDAYSWHDFKLTSLVYIFEAAYYPDLQNSTSRESSSLFSNNQVYENQSENNGQGFYNSDLLLAHNRMYISNKYDEIKLKFHHVFAMVRVIAKVGVNEYGGLPEDAIVSAKLVNIQREYKVDYTQTIQNDGLRTVTGTEDLDETGNEAMDDDVVMWKYKTTTSSSNNVKEQTYIFYAIIPVPSEPIKGFDFLHFDIKDREGKKTKYRFVPNNAIPLEQSHITTLRLDFSKEGSSPLLLSAEIQPWEVATQDMELGAEDTSSEDENETEESKNENI